MTKAVNAEKQDEARRLIDRLVKISPDAGTLERARRLQARIKLPMSVVLDKVPGGTVIEKAKRLKVSRQTLYYWLNGVTRPNDRQSKLIASLTGFDAAEIRGRADGA